jgi:RNA polymerase sigma-70 factor (sigma-E family)
MRLISVRTTAVITEEAAISGTRSSLADLYSSHAPRAIRLAYLLTGDRALSEDIVQDAFVKIAGRFGDRRGPDVFAGYLRRTVVNLVNSHLRRRRVERAYMERQRGHRQELVTDARDLGARDELRLALLRLPLRQRTAIVLRFYADLSEYETADAMATSVSAVKSSVHRGMQALRKELGVRR